MSRLRITPIRTRTSLWKQEDFTHFECKTYTKTDLSSLVYDVKYQRDDDPKKKLVNDLISDFDISFEQFVTTEFSRRGFQNDKLKYITLITSSVDRLPKEMEKFILAAPQPSDVRDILDLVDMRDQFQQDFQHVILFKIEIEP